MSIKISIIIVSWNVRHLLQANLERLFSLNCKYPIEVFVVDNGSHDGTAAMVREEFPRTQLITNDWDAGFAGPNNQALRLAKGDICILLNPDMLVEEGALEKVYEKLMSDTSIGVLGIKLLGQNKQPIPGSVRRLPDFASQFAILLKIGKLFPGILKKYLFSDFDFTRSQDVDQVRGSFFCFRRELLDSVGYLDDKYHIWFEEVDYCLRVKQAGMRVYYLSDAVAHDYVGKSVSQMPRTETQIIFGGSMARYFKKWKPWWQYALIQAARPVGLFFAAVYDLGMVLRKALGV